MSKFDSLDNSSPVLNDLRASFVDCPLGKHDLSYTKNMSIIPGAITVVDCHKMIPNERYEVNFNALLQTMQPLARPSLTGWRLYFHTFYSRDISLWKGANAFYTRGRDQKQLLEEPRIALRDMWSDSGAPRFGLICCESAKDYSTPNSLADDIGCVITSYNFEDPNEFNSFKPLKLNYEAQQGVWRYCEDSNGGPLVNNVNDMTVSDADELDDFGFRYSALPFVLYQKICIYNFYNTNVLQENKYLFPDDEDDLRLPYNCAVSSLVKSNGTRLSQSNFSYVNVLDALDPTDVYRTSEAMDNLISTDAYFCPENVTNDNPIVLTAKHFRQWRGDYYNTSSPFPELLRGDIPTLDDFVKDDIDSRVANITQSLFNDSSATPPITSRIGQNTTGGWNYLVKSGSAGNDDLITSYLNDLKQGAHSSAKATTLRAIKELEIATIFLQRFGLTDGSYNQMINSQFGYNPHQFEHRPQYCGGSFQDVSFNEVTDTSSSGLGNRVCNGVSLAHNDSIVVRSPDYGWCMTVCELVPDIQYNKQGVDRSLQAQRREDIFWPINEKLGSTPIYNQELYTRKPNTAPAEWLRMPFGYGETYGWLKSRMNKQSGFFALRNNGFSISGGTPSSDPRKLLYSQMVATRDLDDAVLNNAWLTMTPDNIQASAMEQFASKNELPFCLTVGINAHSVSPLSSYNTPCGLGGLNA